MQISNDERSLEPIEHEDLERLAKIAERECNSFLRRRGRERFRDRILAIALCQGAGLHFVDRKNGVKDFDVYVFFRAADGVRGPHNRKARCRDFGKSKFGRWPGDPTAYVGRRIDIFWRTIGAEDGADAAAAISDYLRSGKKCSTPWHLSKKAVVLLRPASRLGEVVWRSR